MPAEPFFDSHAEEVEVLVHLFDQSDRLDDGLVLTVDVELHVVSGEGVGQSQLGLIDLELIL